METSTATIRKIRISPKKLILFADAIRGKSLDDAYWIVRSSRKGYKDYLIHALTNAESILKNKNVSVSDIIVKNVKVDQGPRLKRFRPGSRGYSYTYIHPLSHLTIELSSKSKKPKKVKAAKQIKKLRRPDKSVGGTESRSKASGDKNGPQSKS